MKARIQYLGLGLLTTAVYIASAKLGLTLAFVAEQVTVVWPPTGIALCAALILGYRVWPAIWIGAFIANITTNAPAITSIGIATGNTLEAVVGALLLNKLVSFRPSLHRFRDIFGLILLAAGVSTTVSATIGVTSLCLTGMQPWSRFGSLWGVWFLGDAMGDVLVAPVALTFFASESRERLRARRHAEIALFVALIVIVDVLIFSSRSPLGPRYHPPDYAVFPLIIWAALRFGAAGTALGTFITATIAVLGTVAGNGPFASGNTNENLISLQLFMFVAAATGLIMATANTERDEAEKQLNQSEQRYRSLVVASSQVVWSTSESGEVIEDLPTWRAFTGQSKEETMNRGWMQKVHPDDIERVREVWERSLETRTPHENEFRVMTADGTYRNVLARSVPVLQPDGEVREWVGTLTDITQKKRAEREMQEANRRKDEFLAMLAHELRNPLAPIRNAVEIIRTSKNDAARIDWTCDVMERQIHHMSRLLDDLLDVSRITRGEIQLYKQTTDLNILVRRTIDASRPVIEKKEMQLSTDYANGAVPISADVTRIEQVITNLLNNAAKFTPAGGNIWISVDRGNDMAILKVRDNGRGMSPDLLPRIFDLFAQGDRSLARSEGGMGIGLTLVQSLVSMHGGTIEAKSAGLGFGSEFIVRLPMLPVVPNMASRSDDRRAISERKKKRVLVVEDNFDSAETLAAMLKIMGHHVHIAHDGPSGLDEFSRIKPSIVLLDIGLPGITGYEVAEKLRAQSGTELRIIALTGYGSDADRERVKAAGFDHHLVKPVDFNVLEKLINA